MKYLLSALTYLKFLLIPPFAALCIWVMTNFSSSLTRFVVPFLEQSRDAFYQVGSNYFPSSTQNSNWAQMSYDFMNAFYVCIDYVGNWIVGINNWFPLEIIVNTAATLILLQISYLILRFVLKLITIGQI